MVAFGGGRFFFLGAVGIQFLLESRSFGWLSAVPLALALGALIGAAISGRREVTQARPSTSRRPLIESLLTAVAVAPIVLLALVLNLGAPTAIPVLAAPLTIEERAAMRWVAAAAPPSTRFVVVSGDGWAYDRSSEWFPVLAQRTSVATVQGTEWLPDHLFARRKEQHRLLQSCGQRDAACLDEWARNAQMTFTHVYVAERDQGPCCSRLRDALRSDPSYRTVYRATGVTIFERSAS
jgi:hypothetical protein